MAYTKTTTTRKVSLQYFDSWTWSFNFLYQIYWTWMRGQSHSSQDQEGTITIRCSRCSVGFRSVKHRTLCRFSITWNEGLLIITNSRCARRRSFVGQFTHNSLHHIQPYLSRKFQSPLGTRGHQYQHLAPSERKPTPYLNHAPKGWSFPSTSPKLKELFDIPGRGEGGRRGLRIPTRNLLSGDRILK